MRVTYKWLEKYIDLTGITPSQLASVMTKGGFEVETMEKQAYGNKLVIGKVLTCVNHPSSDHLHLCEVDVKTEVLKIVCGAPNVAANQKVIVALNGCVLPNGEIKASVIRGEESNGMICSLSELGVDKKNLTEQQLAGIEVLPDDAPIGDTDVLAYLNLDDTIYEVSLTPNRSDCYSMWAFAKDVAALLDREAHLPDYSYQTEKQPNTLKVVLDTDKSDCFVGTVINHVEIKPSPQWLVDSLHASGINAINNVVDISNYVMLETGQPLHFYDLAKIPAKEITVKTGLNEMYTALDGQQYHVLEDDIMITTENKAIGYAGIMGGDDSKIDENTTGIIIEAAHFNSVNIRNTSRRLSLFTEAATRFTKGIDPLACYSATDRSIQLLIELANASGIEETTVVSNSSYQPLSIECSLRKVNALLGTKFTYQQVFDVFKRLDFKPVELDDDRIVTSIPSYRRDISIHQDLVEEVIRVLGYENIVSTLPKMATTLANHAYLGKEERIMADILLGNGYSEVVTYSLISKEKDSKNILSIGQPVRIANALGEDRRYYRTGLLASMLDTVAYNFSRNNQNLKLYEFGDVYSDDGKQSKHLAIAACGKTDVSKWQKQQPENDFYSIKGMIINLLDKFGYDEKRIFFKPLEKTDTILHPYRSGLVYIGRTLVGVIGQTHPKTDKEYGISPTTVAELDLKAVFSEKGAKVKFTTINKYPAVEYDLALVVKEEVSAGQIVDTVKKAAGSLLNSVEIFDVYRGSNIEKGYKSVAINIIYRSSEKTLTEKDINPIHSKVIDSLSRNLDAILRD
ncbi:MAG: phenylalanine--tRNA ligase subunit beta [Erysipelotrichaceae bacterium]